MRSAVRGHVSLAIPHVKNAKSRNKLVSRSCAAATPIFLQACLVLAGQEMGDAGSDGVRPLLEFWMFPSELFPYL